MHLVHKIFDYRQKSEGGFVLIAALMAVMILMAVGFLALTVTSQDILISSRLVGERKALSAAEAGAQQLCVSLNIAAPQAISACADLTNDPSSCYTTTIPIRDPNMPTMAAAGSGNLAQGSGGSVYDTTVTGSDASHNSSVSIAIQTVSTSNPSNPIYGN
ncbi:MAG: hypothetical protein ABSF79_01090 [Smithellaceae bacterium]|jgi:Tfp pilus assembly protein PilX